METRQPSEKQMARKLVEEDDLEESVPQGHREAVENTQVVEPVHALPYNLIVSLDRERLRVLRLELE